MDTFFLTEAKELGRSYIASLNIYTDCAYEQLKSTDNMNE